MLRFFKWLIMLCGVIAVAFVLYAVLGPLLGADFSAPIRTVTVPIDLGAQ